MYGLIYVKKVWKIASRQLLISFSVEQSIFWIEVIFKNCVSFSQTDVFLFSLQLLVI